MNDENKIQQVEAKLNLVRNEDGTFTHLAKVKFGEEWVLGVGPTPMDAIKDAFTKGLGAKEFEYSPHAVMTDVFRDLQDPNYRRPK